MKKQKEVENWINTDAKNKDYFEELKFYWDYESTGSKQADFDSEKGLNAIQSKRADKKAVENKTANALCSCNYFAYCNEYHFFNCYVT